MMKTTLCAVFGSIILAAALDRAAEPPARTASEILQKVDAAYAHITSLRIVAKREESVVRHGQTGFGTSDFELMMQGQHRYAVRFSDVSGRDAVAISDGETTWRALPSKKQWSQIAAASSVTSDQESSQPEAPRRDLLSVVASTVFGQYLAVTKAAENPQVVRSEDVKVAGSKIPCYVVHCRAGKVDYDLWIDKQRFLIIQDRERLDSSGSQVEMR